MELDYSNLKYDLSKVPAGKCVIDIYPELSDYIEFSKKYEDDIIRWIILLVDDGSPFFQMHRDFKERAKAVFKHLGFNHPNLKGYIEDELSTSEIHERFRIDINSKIYKYFIILDKNTYTAWYSIWSNFQQTNAFLQIQIDPDDDSYENKFEKKQKITEKLPAMQTQLATYEKLIFGDTKIKQIVVNTVAKITNWPEKLAIKQPTY